MSDEYLKTDAYITILVPGEAGEKRLSGIRQTGIARSGICQPGPWPARAVYKYDGKYWVYEAGWLVPADEWHKHQRELGEQ